jgi:4-hydroxy-tetrahydrodipicolinate synthase
MKTIDFRGVHTALVTPFTAKDNLDEDALEAIIEYQIESGISGLVPCGTTGESPT